MHKAIVGLTLLTFFVLPSAHAEGPAKPAEAKATEAAKPPTLEDAQVAQIADAKWGAPKSKEIPAGAMTSPIAVDASGASLGYNKFPGGYHLGMHWHTAGESTVMVSGSAKLIVDGKSHDIQAGSYFYVPGKTKHDLTCNAGADCVLVTRRMGATDFHFEK